MKGSDTESPGMLRERSMSFAAINTARKPSLVPSPSFRAAALLPRYSRLSVAMTSISSPALADKRGSGSIRRLKKRDQFKQERERIVQKVCELEVATKKDQKKPEFLNDGFWNGRQGSGDPLSPPPRAADGERRGASDGGYKTNLLPETPVAEVTKETAATEMRMAELKASSDGGYKGSVDDLNSANAAQLEEGSDEDDDDDNDANVAAGSSVDGGYKNAVPANDHASELDHLSSGYVKMQDDSANLSDGFLPGSPHVWAERRDLTEDDTKAAELERALGPSFALSRATGYRIIDRFHRVVELLNASPTPPINVQLDCHREMHTLTANFRSDAIMYGRVIISEVALPVEQKTIKPLESSGILGGDKYRVGSVYFKFAVDRLHLFGGKNNEDAAAKVAGHELKALVQVMECNISSLRFPLLCLVDYLGFRLIAMSTLPIRGRHSLIYGSMDGGRSVASTPETLQLMKQLGTSLNLKEHGLQHQPETLRIFTPADLELHRGDDGFTYALDFSRLFPPDECRDGRPGGMFYQLLRPEFVRKYHKPLCSDACTSFLTSSERDVCIGEIRDAHAKLLELVREFGSLLDQERPQADLLAASEKLVNSLHMRGINCRYFGGVLKSCTSAYWRLVLVLEMIARRLKKILFKRLRKAIVQKDSPVTGVSACVAAALKLLNAVFGESSASTAFWAKKILPSVKWYFFSEFTADGLVKAADENMWKNEVVSAANGRILMHDVRAQLLFLLCSKTGLKLGSLTREALKNNPKVVRVEHPFDDADLSDLGVSVTYLPVASFSGGKLKRLMAMEEPRRAKAHELNMQAAQLYKQALRMSPADAQLLRNCAEVEAALGNYARADEFFRLAMYVDPTDAATAFKYAIFYDHSMQLANAERWYLKALDLLKAAHRVPVMVSTYADFLLTERRNVDLAREIYEKVLLKHPTHVQTAHNLAVLLFESDVPRAKQLFKVAIDNAEDDARTALIARSCSNFYFAIHDIPTGMRFYKRYKELKHLITDHQPALYHATRSIFGPEMSEIREILGPSQQFKVRHVIWDEIDDDEWTTGSSLSKRLERSVQRLFGRLQVPCSSEITYLSVAGQQIPSWEFKLQGRAEWAKARQGTPAQVGIILGYQDADGFQQWEEFLDGTIVTTAESDDMDESGLEGAYWESIFMVKGFRKTLSEMRDHRAMLNVRRRAYLRMWSTVSDSFVEGEDEDESAGFE